MPFLLMKTFKATVVSSGKMSSLPRRQRGNPMFTFSNITTLKRVNYEFKTLFSPRRSKSPKSKISNIFILNFEASIWKIEFTIQDITFSSINSAHDSTNSIFDHHSTHFDLSKHNFYYFPFVTFEKEIYSETVT